MEEILEKEREGFTRIRILVEGIVQGVGFRPFVYGLAQHHRLSGWVSNNFRGVVIEVEGDPAGMEGFLSDLQAEAPPLARITGLRFWALPLQGDRGFVIRESQGNNSRRLAVPADTTVCKNCLRELFDPADRRYRYPFINCTHCGPRFTIVRDIPYDRLMTTMASFQMCPTCEREYTDPTDRRFHAQPNACWDCGPSLRLLDQGGKPMSGEDPLESALELLRDGGIMAVKGLGGFHLAADASNQLAIRRLRERKRREEKPFAVMACDLRAVRRFCRMEEEEAELLESASRPIVLLARRRPDLLAPAVAPDNHRYGVMLPYTPLHHLLIQGPFPALVMTSGNPGNKPLAKDDREALRDLQGIAEGFLTHDRDIFIRADDSVARVVRGRTQLLRRARGYVPRVIPLRPSYRVKREPVILALGGELKSTICLVKGDQAYLSQHIGDLENAETYEVFRETVLHFQRILKVEPELLAHDLHPDYLSTQYAMEQEGIDRVGVQHHHAHMASCLAEHGWEGKAIGVVFDGTGYGLDGSLWGGEFLVGDGFSFVRRAHFACLPLPGGAAAILHPYRMAVSYLYQAFGEDIRDLTLSLLDRIPLAELEVLLKVIRQGINAPSTSGCGRLFDAVAALVGLRDRISFEGQAAMELEMALEEGPDEAYDYQVLEGRDAWVLDWRPLIREVVEDLGRGREVGLISLKFHNALVGAVVDLCDRLREEGKGVVALTGGVFQNAYLQERMTERLEQEGFRVFTHLEVPPNDGGLSLGQAVVARSRSRGDHGPCV